MRLDNRARDGQAHTHSVGFGGVETAQRAGHFSSFQPDTRVLHAKEDRRRSDRCIVFSLNQQNPASLRDRIHGVHSVHHQIEQYLLELHTVAGDVRQSWDRSVRIVTRRAADS